MAEEHACLVRASDSESSCKLGSFGSLSRTMTYTDDKLNGTEGSGEPASVADVSRSPTEEHPDGAERGELIDYNDASVLEHFHEDALRQAGCGLSQVRVVLATALAVAGCTMELAAVPFILPSAEIEFCIQPHEKSWLVMITIVGSALGSAGWGALGERLGRRRALVSCLAVNVIFAAIAAFMPTYGTFMMARFCSALGSGGVVVCAGPYVCETCGAGAARRAGCGALGGAGGAGALAAAALAHAALPPNGAAALLENKEHFSAWHRYLLLCMLPLLASLFSLIWTPESPRYLLEAGREVDAMMTYQSIHRGNQIRVCGAGGGGGAGVSAVASAELALPGKRRPAALHHMRHSVKLFWQSFFQLFSNTYRSTTLSLAGTLVLSVALQLYLSAYVPATVTRIENEEFEASKRIIDNMTINNEHFNGTLENVEYLNVTFNNCTFNEMLFSHVTFINCSFFDVAFSNIKTSYTVFKESSFVNSSLIDTEVEAGQELQQCAVVGTVVRGMRGRCRPDLTSRLAGLAAERAYCAYAALAAALPLLAPAHPRHVLQCGALVLLSPSLYLAQSETALYVVEAVYNFFTTLIFFTVILLFVDMYPANLRCTGIGISLCVAGLCGAAARAGGPANAAAAAAFIALLAVAAAATALKLSHK